MDIEKTSLGAEGKAPSHPPSETTQGKDDSDVTASTHGAASNDLAVESTTLDAVGAKQLGKARKICLGVVMAMTYFLASASNSAVVLVIPRISRDLQISDLASQWVVSAFTLANGCSLLVAGRFADIYGRKHLYLLGMSINAVFSLAAAFVRQRIALCVLRAFAGAGQAIAMPAAFGIVGVSFIDEHERTIAFALMGMGFPVGGALGQVIGGVIAVAGTRAWQYIFVLLSGIAFLAVVAGVIIIPSEPKKTAMNDRRVDWVGAILVMASLGAFSFSITQGGLVREGWKAAYIPVVFVISLVIMSTFVAWEYYVMKRTTLPPLVHLRLFRRHGHRVTYVLLTALTAYTAINGWVYFTTIWYQNLKGLSSMQNALYVLPAPIVGIFACAIVPPLAKRVKAPYLLFFGGFMTAAACWLFAVQPYPGTSYWACEFIVNIANPFGADFTVGIGSVLISNLAAKHEQSLLGALFQTVLQLSGTIGICLCSLIQEIVYRDTGDLHKALTTVCWMMAGFAWSSSIIVVVTLRRVGLAKDVTKLD